MKKELQGELGTLASVKYLYSTEGKRIVFDDMEHLNWFIKQSLEIDKLVMAKELLTQVDSLTIKRMQQEANTPLGDRVGTHKALFEIRQGIAKIFSEVVFKEIV